MIVAVFISDRGDTYLPGCLSSFVEYVEPVTKDLTVIDDRDHLLGMAGAVRAGFEWALSTEADYVWWVEEDFVFERPVPLTDMADVLDNNPHLAQLCLKRQPWSSEEKAAGGIVERFPERYDDWGQWTEHDEVFSLNPCLIPRRVLELGWSDDNERGFTKKCRDAGYRFAFWGAKFAPPMVTHVGKVRGTGWRL